MGQLLQHLSCVSAYYILGPVPRANFASVNSPLEQILLLCPYFTNEEVKAW